MDRIAENCNQVLTDVGDNDVTLCLETTAGQGTNLGYSFEQIAYMLDRIEDREHVGVCLDTCHIFAAGYPIIDPGDYAKTIEQFDDTIGLNNLKIIHVNDSKGEFGSRKDRHEHIGEGHIGLEGFRNFVNDPRMKDIPFILETPKEDDLQEDIENLKKLRALVEKRH